MWKMLKDNSITEGEKLSLLYSMDKVLGLDLDKVEAKKEEKVGGEEEWKLVEERKQAKAEKNYQRADEIRKELEEELTSDEKNAAGCWFWSQPAHSDNVDLTKYAVNDQQPEESRSWVISIQNHVFTPEDSIHPAIPGQKFLTDENTNLSLEIDPTDEFFCGVPDTFFCAVFVCVHVCGIGSISPRPLC